jgi:hypothetical protein
MNKKVFIGLVPLVAIAAFVVLPGVSQAACTAPACPHVYKNGVAGEEGKKVREIWWGTLKLKTATLGDIECHSIWGGFEENPVGGGVAHGQVQVVYPYECVDETCTKTLGGTAIHVIAGKLPWLTQVIEPTAGDFRDKIAGADFTIDCQGVTTPEVSGEMEALNRNNGTSIGSGPGERQLKLQSEGGVVEGDVKVLGYGTEELIEVKNP